MSRDVAGVPASEHHIYVYGKFQDPLFQMYSKAASFLAQDRRDVEATIEGFFETQYEQKLRSVVHEFSELAGGSSFKQAKPSTPLVFAEKRTQGSDEEEVLFFQNQKRFFEWLTKRFKYEDNTRLIFYKRMGNKALKEVKQATGRSYCAINLATGNDPAETVHLELFDEECPILAKNFLDLLALPTFNGHKVHRVKAGSWVQMGDLVDGSGRNSECASGGYLRHESFKILHDRAGLLGMANQGKDTNGSQFYITLREMPFLDGRSVIFGRVISGMRTILKLSKAPTRNERPVTDVIVSAHNEITVGSAQDRAAGQVDSTGDV